MKFQQVKSHGSQNRRSFVAIALLAIIRFRVTKQEKNKWVYPALLASFPFYYFVFAIYAADYEALIIEVFVSLVFIFAAYFSYKKQNVIGLVVLSGGYISHAIYDIIHDRVFINAELLLGGQSFVVQLMV